MEEFGEFRGDLDITEDFNAALLDQDAESDRKRYWNATRQALQTFVRAFEATEWNEPEWDQETDREFFFRGVKNRLEEVREVRQEAEEHLPDVVVEGLQRIEEELENFLADDIREPDYGESEEDVLKWKLEPVYDIAKDLVEILEG